MFLKRSYEKELMDDFSLSDDGIAKALGELHTINKFLGGNSVTRKGLKFMMNDLKSGPKILDVGGGGSDILYDIKREFNHIRIYSVDLNRYSCRYQKNMMNNSKIICADARRLPVKAKSFEIVHASLFLHHFNEEEIVQLIGHFLYISKKGVIVNDLRRNFLAYYGISILTSLFSKSKFVKNDAPLSVRRAFHKKDIVKILSILGIKNYIIKRMWAFRFLVLIPAEQK
jgi:ubiquinone/menaquinone biosynthesis C-methylase UbiE